MRRIFFIHIAKTGGVSVEENLIKETSLTPCPAYNWRALFQEKNISEYKLFLGHLQYFCKDIIGDTFKFTILREPIERAMSGWAHINRSITHPLNASLNEAPTIKLALTHHALHRHISNSMTRFLGCRPEDSKYDSTDVAIRSARRCTPDRVMLENAKECIDELDYIGFTETLSADMLGLYAALEVECKTEEYLIVKNKNPFKQTVSYRDLLDNETVELLKSANELDYELYEYAKMVVHKRKHVASRLGGV